MISTKEYKDILERYGIEVRHGTHGVIDEVMVSNYQEKSGDVILWCDIEYDENGEFTNLADSCEFYEDKELFIKAVEKLMKKYKLLKFQQKIRSMEKDFV